MKRLSSFSCSILLLFFISGCAGSLPQLNMLKPLPEESGCRVAVLPFSYHGLVPRGEKIFYSAFVSELAAMTSFHLVEEGDILEVYRQMKMFRKTVPTSLNISQVSQRLDAGLIMTGDILTMKEDDQGREVQTSLTLLVRIHDGETGEMIWETYHKRDGKEYRHVLHFGRVNSITGLAQRMADEIITRWKEEGLPKCAQ